MEVIVRGKHFEVPEHVEERARRKFGKLHHYLPALEDAAVEVDLAHEKAKEPHLRYVVHVNVNGHGVHLHAEERAAQLEAAVDQAARVVTDQARRHKKRVYDRSRPRASRKTAASPEPAEKPVGLEGTMRLKRFLVKPMTPEEAAEQMEALGHDFFVFHHADADQFALLYRRRAGGYGLIIPELS